MVRLSDAPVMIIEGDEYLSSPIDPRPKMLLYHAEIAVLTGIAWDHMNVFKTFDDYTRQFELFVDTIVKVHGKKPVSADNCEIGLCYFKLEKSALLAQQFIKGESTRITISTDRAKIFLDKDITLSGFVAAFWKFQAEVVPFIWAGWQLG